MPKISSNLGSWSTQIYETFRGVSPISFFNRVCLFDRTCFFDRVWSAEPANNTLKEKIQICKEKAGIRGEKYLPVLETWKKEVVGLAEGVQKIDASKALPSQASPKNEKVYNYEIAKAATNQELDTLSKNVSTYTTLLMIHNQLGPGPEVDSGVIMDLIAQNEKNPQKDIFDMYIEHFSEKMRWGFFQRTWLKCAYYFSSGIISGVIHTTFQNMLEEIRLSTDGKTERIFGDLLDHLEKFLKDYSGETPLEDFIEKKDMPALCKELSPYLVSEFFPRISFFKVMFKKIPFMSVPVWLLDSTVGVFMNLGVRMLVRKALPDILQTLSETLEATVMAKLTDKDTKAEEPPINYRLAIPIFRFINEKLFGFATMLKEPPMDIDEPPPPRMAAKLEGVIDELMKLSQNPSNDPMIREGMRNGLIDGGYQLMKYWQKEQESLLQQALILSSLPFTESQEPSNLEADKKEFEGLWDAQTKLLDTVNDRVFSLEVKKFFGSPSSQVTYLLAKEHKKIKRYLEEGLSDIIGLKSSLRKASQDLKKPDYRGYDVTLGKHLIFWDGFLSMMKAGTKNYNPKPVNEILFREFYPLCTEASAQIDRISELQDEWVLYTRHKELKRHFYEIGTLLAVKRVQDLKLSQIQNVLNKIEVLLPPNPLEVQILKRFVESFSSLKNIEGFLKDLISVKALLKKQKQSFLNRESLEEFKAFLSKYPELQKDREFSMLYKRYSSLCQGEAGFDGMSKDFVLQEISKKIEREIQEQSQKNKDLQLNLLHRIYPNKKVTAFSVPCPLGDLIKELGQWVMQRRNGYDILEKRNLSVLQEGTKDLEQHVDLLERKIHKMEPHTLYFPLESVLDGAAWVSGDISNVPGIRTIKQHLLQDLTGILAGVTPLITAKKEEGKRNLYSWIETLALYESLKHFKSKAG